MALLSDKVLRTKSLIKTIFNGIINKKLPKEYDMKEIKRQFLTGERSLFLGKDLYIEDTTFGDGESPLKEAQDITLENVMFKWKYPLWYCKNIKVNNSYWFEMARSGIWYTDNISMTNTVVEAPKNFRRASNIYLENVQFPNAAEMLWSCRDIKMKDVTAKGDYFAMNSKNIEADNLTLVGNYAFDGSSNITVRNSKMLSKDAFWNTENATVYDSTILGEYLGWNSKKLTFINCTIESLQGLCYIDNLVMKNCKLINTTLAFEYCSNIDAEITGKIDSVLNPTSGTIKADYIDELIIEKDKIDPSKTRIICRAEAK